jgi:DNA repair photolyase
MRTAEMTHQIQARVLLSRVRQPDPWFGLTYVMNLYRGCQHQCIYCDSRSECYGITDFADIGIKANALELLERELRRKRRKGTIGTGAMNDPYMPLEKTARLTGRALRILADHNFPVHVMTKSDLVLRDIDVLQDIRRTYAAVTFTITTADDALGRVLEPGAPLVSRRLAALRRLADAGILAGVAMMPVLPFLEDTQENVLAIARLAMDAGTRYLLPSFAVTLRDRQRDYFYRQLDASFPGLRQKYQACYGERYVCRVPLAAQLERVFLETCDRLGLATRMPVYAAAPGPQLPLL